MGRRATLVAGLEGLAFGLQAIGEWIMSTTSFDISNLTTEERLGLLEKLWESFEAHPESLPLTDSQREELDRRIEDMERDGSIGIPREEVVRRIKSKSK